MNTCPRVLLYLAVLASCAWVCFADELHMKDGSIIRGKLIKEIPGESYRMLLNDRSEVVYSSDKVQSVEFGTTKVGAEKKTAVPMATGVVEPAGGDSISTADGWDNTVTSSGTAQNYVKGVTLGFGLGKYGTVGAEVNFRTGDTFGLSLGVGAQYYQVDYTVTEYYEEYHSGYWSYYDGWHPSYYTTESYTESKNDSGFSALGGVKAHFYFTPRSQPVQHNLFLAGYYGETIGPAFGVGYGFERHGPSGAGWDLSVGLVAAPNAEKYLAEKLGVAENDMDFTWIPLLFEIGFFF